MPDPMAVVLARAWYTLTGVAVLLVGAIAIIPRLASGCRITISQADVQLLPGEACVQYVDLPTAIVAIVIGLLALTAALWALSSAGWQRVVAWIGIAAGLLACLVPAWFIISAAFTGYRLSMLGILIAVVPIVGGLCAAWILVRARRNHPTPIAEAPAA